MTEFAKFNLKKWPIVEVTLNGIPSDYQEFEYYLQAFDLLYGKKKKFNLLIDATNVGNVSFVYVARQAMHMHQNEDKTKKYVSKIALIINSQFAKNLLKSLFQHRKPVCETKIFKLTESGQKWINS
jgi:hypothetical protein